MNDRMLELNKKLNEASYSTQKDYFDAKDMSRAVDAAMSAIESAIIDIESETSDSLDIPSSINIADIVRKQLNMPKIRKEIEKKYKKGI